MKSMIDLWHDEDGVTTVEYALLLSTVVFASLGAWTALGETIRETVNEAATQIGTGEQ
ncbi:MAG: Flp family type IVb pilin [Armatimonadota bacterium]